MIHVGRSAKNQQAISLGNKELGRVYVGDKLVWEKARAFIFTVSVTAGLNFTLPLVSGSYSYACTVDWGDGSAKTSVTAYNSAGASHNYAAAGSYDVKIKGTCQGFSVNNGTMRQYITKVLSWGYCDFRKFDLFGAYVTELPMTKITGMNNITSFVNFMSGTGLYTGLLSDQWFEETPNVLSFQNAFAGCMAVGGVTVNLFKNCPKVTSFAGTFNNCYQLHQSLPEDLFWGNTKATSFFMCFGKCYQIYGTLPEKLFRYCPDVNDFSYCFYFGGSAGGNLTGEIPRDFFAYNTKVISFEWTFRWNLSIGGAPNGLFRNNILCRNFSNTFNTCPSLTLGQYVFSGIDPNIPGDTEAAAAYRRFSGKTIDFTNTFTLNYYNPLAGTRHAPALWDPLIYDMVGSSHVGCFSRNTGYTTEPYSNQVAIPVGWK